MTDLDHHPDDLVSTLPCPPAFEKLVDFPPEPAILPSSAAEARAWLAWLENPSAYPGKGRRQDATAWWLREAAQRLDDGRPLLAFAAAAEVFRVPSWSVATWVGIARAALAQRTLLHQERPASRETQHHDHDIHQH